MRERRFGGGSKNNNILLCPSKLYKKWPSLLQKAWPSLSLAIAIISLVFFPASCHQSVLHNIAEHFSELLVFLPSYWKPPLEEWVRVKHKHFGVAHLALLNLTLNTSPPPLLLVRSPPSLFSYSSPSPYTWTISFRQLVGLGAGHALISNRRPFAHPYSLCLWCPLFSLSSHWC